MARVVDKASRSTGGFESYLITDHINKINDDMKEQLMMICKGDVNQYESLKLMSVSDYLVKLDRYVSEIEILKKK